LFIGFVVQIRRVIQAVVMMVVCFEVLGQGVLPVMAAEPKPNVVFIFADDLGWSDTTIYEATRSQAGVPRAVARSPSRTARW